MKLQTVKMVRVYLTEGEHKLKGLLELLHDEEQVKGVTVFRGIAGFGRSGKLHASRLIELSSDLPLVVEFFDDADKIVRILTRLQGTIEPGHTVVWSAQVDSD